MHQNRHKKPAILTERAEGLLLLLESNSYTTDSTALIFHAPDGGPVLLETANKHFKSSCIKAGIDPRGRTQYCLRYSFNTHALHMLQRTDVQKLMGHKTDIMTRHYYHPADEDLLHQVPESARKKLEDIW
jgi:integrase